MSTTILNKDQAGVENRIYITNGNTTASPIITTACWYPIVSAIGGTGPTVYGSGSSDFQYIPGQVCALTSVADNGSGKARFYMAGGHPFITGNAACIASNVSAYNGNVTITYVDSTHFDTTTSYTSTATGSVIMGDRLKCLLAANYYPFKYSYNAYFKSGNAGATVYTALAISGSAPWAANIGTLCADTTTYHEVCSEEMCGNLSGLELQFAYGCNRQFAPTFASIELNIEADFANGSKTVSSAGAQYFGNPENDGSWRIIRSGTGDPSNLLTQVRISGTWTTVTTDTHP